MPVKELSIERFANLFLVCQLEQIIAINYTNTLKSLILASQTEMNFDPLEMTKRMMGATKSKKSMSTHLSEIIKL